MAQATDRTEAEVTAATSRIRPHVRGHRFYNPSTAQPHDGPSTTIRAGPHAFAPRVDPAPVSWTPRRGGRLLARHDRDDLVGSDGRAGRCASGAERPAERRRRCSSSAPASQASSPGTSSSKLGYDFRILEARDRVGGLAWTVRRGTEHTEIGGERQVCTFDEGQHVNVGAWRIPYTHTGVLNYCKELGVPLQIFLNEADGSYFYYEGTAAGSLSNTRVRLREVKADLDRPHQRAARQGNRSAPARSAADGRGSATAGGVSRSTGVSRAPRTARTRRSSIADPEHRTS